ncbi:hypothetical protein ACMATQ_000743 [Klebsiella michiganensis]
MTKSTITRERLEEIRDCCWMDDLGLSMFELSELARMALAALDSEPVEPIWRATKYPVSRPVPDAKLIVWDETGKFVGYGSAVDTSESGVAIQMCDGRRFDSNHELRWQYALQPVPVVDNEPVGWTDEEELRDVNVAGIGYLFGIDREANKFADPRRQIMLYRHAQQPVVAGDGRAEFEAWMLKRWGRERRDDDFAMGKFIYGEDYADSYTRCVWKAWSASRAAMLAAAPQEAK